MKVIILGAGQVGYSIARYLAFEENDITVVDQSAELLKKISDKIDIQPIVGFACHPEVLKQAGAYEANLLIAVTGSDEVNMIACELSHSLFNVETKIARIRHQNYLKSDWSNMFHPQRLAIDVTISPETEVAKALSRSTHIVGAFDVLSLSSNQIKIIGVRCYENTQIINTPLRLLPGLFPKLDIAILCINRADKIFFPNKDDTLHLHDEIYFAVKHEDVDLAMHAFGYHSADGRRILIIGAGSIGKALAENIENHQKDVSTRLIEKDLQQSEIASRSLKYAEVLHGDALDYEVLNEANVQQAETVVAVTNDDKVNILAALLAKRSGANRALTLLNNMNYASLVTSLGIDAVINPRAITVSTILQHVRQGRIRAVHTLGDGYAEVIEAEAKETSQIIGLTIDDITIKGSVVIASIIRDGNIFLMPKKMIVNIGDRLIIIAKKEAARKIEKLFSLRPSYL